MTARRLLVAHPSADVYGSDLQLLETLRGARDAGWSTLVVVPADGPLVARLEEVGARVVVAPFPVLRKSELRPLRLLRLAATMVGSTVRSALRVRRAAPDVVLVNTVTIPQWALAARLAGRPVVCHVHEAEQDHPRVVRAALAAPMLLARTVVANSAAARDVVVDAVPALGARLVVVHNGVAGPPEVAPPRVRRAGDPATVVLVGRLSPRKGTDVAVAAVERLVERGYDVRLRLCGSVFPGYEWFEQELRDRAEHGPARGRVELTGYVRPTWPHLAAADVVLVPSRVEPFGNAAVEAMLAGRPLVASAAQGLREVVTHGRTGLLVPPDDAGALADAVAALLDDPARAADLAVAARADAEERFDVDRYRARLAAVLDDVAGVGSLSPATR